MTTKSPTVTLTDDQVAFYHRNGYLAIPNIMPLEEVAWMRKIYDRLFAQKAGREVGDQFDLAGTDEEGGQAVLPQILGPAKYAPELRDSQLWVNAEAMVKQLLGPEAHFGDGHMIFKPACIGAETPWHQDEAYWDPSLEYTSLSIWVPLQEATVENGCMWFVPGTQDEPVHEHRSVGGDVRIHALEMVNPPLDGAVACPLPPGGATFHSSRTFHYTGANRSEVDRRAYILSGGTEATKRSHNRRFPWNEIKQTARSERERASKS